MVELYAPNNSTYTKHGDVILAPVSCEISAELNGAWGLALVHPIDSDGRWKSITAGAVIRADSFNGSQLWRIRQVVKTEQGIQAAADPIFMDSRGDCFILSAHPTNATGQAALNALVAANSKYSASSNIVTQNTAYFERRNLIDCIAGATPSFLERWGGEILYNNNQIIINTRVGGDYGVRVLYGRNIAGISETYDTDAVITRIIPVSYNGHTLSGSTPWVDSAHISAYPTIHAAEVKYDRIKLAADVTGEAQEGDEIYDTLAELRTALQAAAEADFTAGVDAPAVSLSINMILLQDTEEYKDFTDLETVSLGDTVHCTHSRLGITSDARVVAIKYDSLRNAATAVTLSTLERNIFDRLVETATAVAKAIRPSGTVVAEQIAGFIDGTLAQLRIQNGIAERQEARAILFEDLDPNSSTYGALAIGTQGLQISRQRTADGRDWEWTTAVTSEGVIASTLIAQETLAVAAHFFADASGVHVTEDEYDATNGNNVFVDGTGVDVRDGTTSMAKFGTSVRVGESAKAHAVFASDASSFYTAAGGLAARISHGTASTASGKIGGGHTGAISSGNGFTFPLWYYPTGVNASTPLTVSMVVNGAAMSLQITDETPVAGVLCTLQYRAASNSVRLTATSDIQGAVLEITGTYYDYDPHFIFGAGIATGANSFVEGFGTRATGKGAHALGRGTLAQGDFSIAAGEESYATGQRSAAIGHEATATGENALAAGTKTRAANLNAAAFGSNTTTNRNNQFVVGEYNRLDSSLLFAVGDGDGNTRVNAFEVDQSGNTKTQNTHTVETLRAGGLVETDRLLYGYRPIPAGTQTNLNADVYMSTRRYICTSSATASGLQNCPTAVYFVMNVYAFGNKETTDSGYITVFRQITDANQRTWRQLATRSANVWNYGAWVQVDSSAFPDLSKTGAISSGGDITAGGRLLEGYTSIPDNANLAAADWLFQGVYICGTAATAATLTNCPTSNYFMLWNKTFFNREPSTPIGTNVTIQRTLRDGASRVWIQQARRTSDGWAFSAWIELDTSALADLTKTGNIVAGGSISADHVRLLNEVSLTYDSSTELTPARICAILKARAADFIAGTNVVNVQTMEGITRATLYVTYINDATTASAFCMSAWQASDVTYYRKPAYSDTWAIYYDPASQNQSAKLQTIEPIEITSLTNGSIYSANGGAWYYKQGTRVHVHLAVSGITSGTVVKLYTMPAGYRPAAGSIIAGAAYSATSTCGCYISGSTGVIYGFTARTNGTATFDFDYDAFS